MKKILKIVILLLLVISCVIFIYQKIRTNEVGIELDVGKEIKQGQILSGELFDSIYNEYTGKANILIGETNIESDLYYKIINTESEYNNYEKLNKELPSAAEIDFEKNLIIIMTKEKVVGINEKDILMTDILLSENVVEINLEQNNLPNYESEYNVWYVILENTINNVNINMKFPKLDTDKVDVGSELLNNYTEEQAIKDGCVIIDNKEIDSESETLVENFFVDVSNDKYSSIRIYETNTSIPDFDEIIVDIVFKDGLTYIQSFNLNEKKIVGYTVSESKIIKNTTDFGIVYEILNETNTGSIVTMYIKK